MPETAESHSFSISTNRYCVFEITNLTSSICLLNPQVYMYSGYVNSPPTPTLLTNAMEVCSFTKDDNTASGAVGVMTYELHDRRKHSRVGKMAVMFSVPFDYNIYKNLIGLGLFEMSQVCDEKLYDTMYNDEKDQRFVRQEADGSGVKFTGKGLDFRACMSDGGGAIVKLELYDAMTH